MESEETLNSSTRRLTKRGVKRTLKSPESEAKRAKSKWPVYIIKLASHHQLKDPSNKCVCICMCIYVSQKHFNMKFTRFSWLKMMGRFDFYLYCELKIKLSRLLRFIFSLCVMLGAWEESTKIVAQSACKKAVCVAFWTSVVGWGGVVLVFNFLSLAVKFNTE